MTDLAKVLIADDEEICVDFVRAALADMPCEVLSASDGQQALDVAREHCPHVIILDVQMPERSGFDVFMELRKNERFAAVPVIMLTGLGEREGFYFDEQEMGEYMGAAPEAYLDKPVKPDQLRELVGRLIGQTSS